MTESFPSALRLLRQAAGYSTAALAARMNFSKAAVGHAETGHQRPTPEFAAAADRVLGTTPLLITVLGIDEEEDDVRRRALLSIFGAAVGVTASQAVPAAALAEVIRHALNDAIDEPADWDQVIDDFQHRLFVSPSPDFGNALLAQITVARQIVADRRDPEAIRATALLSLMYGLWLGDNGAVPAALGWYRTSTAFADRSGDPHARTYVRARSATRGMYEGMPDHLVVAGVGEALALSTGPTLGALEAHAANVQLAALTGDLHGGRRSIATMWEIAEHLPTTDGPGAAQRAGSFQVYLEGRTGTLRKAEQAYDLAEPLLRSVPLWDAEARVYLGRAMIRAGDLEGGIGYALDALRPLPFVSRVVRMGVSDLLAAVPSGYRSDRCDALRLFAATGTGPWRQHDQAADHPTG